MPDVDFIVVGAGLAGACAARRLAAHGSVVIIEKRGPASGGSAAAAGLVNPILGLRARPVWRIEEAVAALDETIALAQAQAAYTRRPTLRPARDDEQVDHFRVTAQEHPEHCTWLDDPACDLLDDPVCGWLRAPLGVLRIETGGAVDIDALVRGLLDGIKVVGAELTGWRETDDGVQVHLAGGRETDEDVAVRLNGFGDTATPATHRRSINEARRETRGLTARRLILALGRGYSAFPELMRLRLHQIKGQTIRMTRPAALPPDAPHLAGTGYVAIEAGSGPAERDAAPSATARDRTAGQTNRDLTAGPIKRGPTAGATQRGTAASATERGPASGATEPDPTAGQTVVCGSTYEHSFADLKPSQRATMSILKKVERMLPSIREAELIEERAGVRVTVPGIRLPMVGPLPGRRNVWIFTGLGAKGLLTGPLVAKELPDYLEDAERIPKDIRVRTSR